jgi:hypothetical protein
MFNTKEIDYLRRVVKHTKLDIISKNLCVDDEKNMSMSENATSKIAALSKLDNILWEKYDETEKKRIILNNERIQA